MPIRSPLASRQPSPARAPAAPESGRPCPRRRGQVPDAATDRAEHDQGGVGADAFRPVEGLFAHVGLAGSGLRGACRVVSGPSVPGSVQSSLATVGEAVSAGGAGVAGAGALDGKRALGGASRWQAASTTAATSSQPREQARVIGRAEPTAWVPGNRMVRRRWHRGPAPAPPQARSRPAVRTVSGGPNPRLYSVSPSVAAVSTGMPLSANRQTLSRPPAGWAPGFAGHRKRPARDRGIPVTELAGCRLGSAGCRRPSPRRRDRRPLLPPQAASRKAGAERCKVAHAVSPVGW